MDESYELLMELMRNDFAVFFRKAFAWLRGDDLIEWNWHLDAIVHQLDRVFVGDCRRLMVNLPPRNGKSLAISVAWVAWVLGRNPRHRFVCVSYSQFLSDDLARLCLSIVQSPWYQELFPRMRLKRSAVGDFTTTVGGGRLATSITGTLTGRGGDTIILDDVIKPQEADSEVVRANVNAWYQSTLSSRLNDKRTGAILLVMQRLHQYDLPGLLLETGGYDVLSLPAIATSDQTIDLPGGAPHQFRMGDILHPERESLATLEEIRAQMGSERFSAQYLQRPVPAIGNIIKAAWLKTYDPATVANAGGIIVQSIDTANKGSPSSDFSVVVTARVVGKYVYFLDVARFRLDYPELRKRVIALAHEYRPNTILIEEQGSGISLIADLRALDLPGKLCILPHILERQANQRRQHGGEIVCHVALKVAFEFVSAADGSSHSVEIWGEGTDRADKATNKALASAYKYAAFQVFCIPLAGQVDGDAETIRLGTERVNGSTAVLEPVQGWAQWTRDIIDMVGGCQTEEAVSRLQTTYRRELHALSSYDAADYKRIGDAVAELRRTLAKPPITPRAATVLSEPGSAASPPEARPKRSRPRAAVKMVEDEALAAASA